MSGLRPEIDNAQGPREPRLLLVDDDPSVLRVMGVALATFADLRFATSGEEALRLARAAPPDLIVLDVEMPGVGGFEVCGQLKADPLLAAVPVIFATSHAATSAVEVAALERGGVDFVTKPLVPSQLLGRVRAQLRTRQLIDELTLDNRIAPRPPIGAARPRPLLLIVDDDIAAIRILRHSLSHLGDVHFSTDGADALEMAQRLRPDLILLDGHMPGLDGFEICSRLKAQLAFRHVPVVFVTRFSDPANEMRALDLGAAEFIAKPYTPAVLRVRMRNLLELKARIDAQLRDVGDHWRRVGDARVAAIVGAASDPILSYGADGKVVLANAAASRMFCVPDPHLVGQPVQALLGARLAEIERIQGGALRIVLPRGASGEHFPAEVSVSHSGEGAQRLTTLVLRDVGEREQFESERRQREQAEAAGGAKSAMLSYIAHEMGNPVNGLLGFTQLMQADSANPLPAAQAQRLLQVVRSAEHLQALMGDVIDLGRHDSGWLALDTGAIDTARCVEEAVGATAALAARAGVVVVSRPGAAAGRLMADEARLHQCLLNLLTNAIKYNRPGGTVGVEVCVTAGSVAIAVRDDGLGMTAEQRQCLFQPFNRLGRERGGARGSGLGLVITRQLVQAMNGRLLVDSTPGQGSCFTIVLARAPEQPLIQGGVPQADKS